MNNEIKQTKDREVVLITGSSGFIGSALVKELSRTYEIVGLDRAEPHDKIPHLHFYSLDITSQENIHGVLKKVKDQFGARLKSVVHLIAYYSFSGEKSSKYQEITIDGTTHLLNELKQNFEVQQFIFSSTMLVYRPTQLGQEISEDSPLDPRWPYPQSKVDAENLIEKIRGPIPVVYLRMAGIYDDNGHAPTITHQIARIYEMQLTSLMFPGDTNHGQAFLHLEDLVESVCRLIEKQQSLPVSLTLVLAEDKPLSFRELQTRIGQLIHHKPWPTFRVPKSFAKLGATILSRIPGAREPFIKPWMIDFADDHYDLNISRVKELLNWEPKRKLANSLIPMVASLMKNPHRWYQLNQIPEPPRLARIRPKMLRPYLSRQIS
jgi:nucleoside-diphosphate-sugar epimerase